MISRNDMCMTDPMPFSQHWEVRTERPIDLIENMGDALREGYSSFKAGDLVNVSSYQDRTWKRLTQVASYRIIACEDKKVHVAQVSEVVKVLPPSQAVVPPEDRDLNVVKVRNAYEVRDESGNTIEAFVDKDQAADFVRVSTTPTAVNTTEKTSGVLTVSRGMAGKFLVRNEEGALVREFSRKSEAEEFVNANSH